MKDIVLRSPAKLNLFLKVVSKRPDGYHNISTLFERIDLSDELRFRLNTSGRIHIISQCSGLPKGKKNLIYQAAQHIKDTYAFADGATITVRKRIPIAAGLAGGSSNAATTIIGLSKLWKLGLTKAEMINFAQKIGSDVPFFIHRCRFGIGKGRGDIIEPLKIRKKLWHIMIVPQLKVYSYQVYRALKLQLTKIGHNANMLPHMLRRHGLSSLNDLLTNDLETAIVQLHPKLLQIKNRIKKLGLKHVSFSGSGPTLFAVCDSQREALRWASVLKKQYKRVFVTCTV